MGGHHSITAAALAPCKHATSCSLTLHPLRSLALSITMVFLFQSLSVHFCFLLSPLFLFLSRFFEFYPDLTLYGPHLMSFRNDCIALSRASKRAGRGEESLFGHPPVDSGQWGRPRECDGIGGATPPSRSHVVEHHRHTLPHRERSLSTPLPLFPSSFPTRLYFLFFFLLSSIFSSNPSSLLVNFS
jgi:hypothetical protein